MALNDGPSRKPQAALRPLESLLSKCEKASGKLAPESWQYKMLRDNVRALRIATALLRGASDEPDRPTSDDLQASLQAVHAMKRTTEMAQTKFSPGTNQHGLLQNRSRALAVAEVIIRDALNATNS